MNPHPLENLLKRGLKAVLWAGVPLAALSLLIPAPSDHSTLFWYVIVQLTVIQVAVFVFVIAVSPTVDEDWFTETRRPWLARTASVVALAVGVAALITLAASAAARYQPSLQFLQLLSSLDIAWVVAALYLGARVLWGPRIAIGAGSALLVACVVSIAVYLNRVGFIAEGGWLVDGGQLLRVVLPSDVMAALISVTAVLLASRRVDSDQPMSQPRAQS